jgi:prepilin peptidase CpaA
MRDAALLLFFPALMAYSAASDLLTMRISNYISIALIVGFGVFAFAAGMSWSAIGWHLTCAALMLTVGFGLWMVKIMGAGDVKLIASTSLWFGFMQTVEYALWFSLLGGLLTVGLLKFRSQPAPDFIVRTPWLFRLHNPKEKVPYGLALGAAALAIYPQTPLWTALAS